MKSLQNYLFFGLSGLALTVIAIVSRFKLLSINDQLEESDCQATYNITDNYSPTDGPFKLLLCVNNDLGMGKGKMCAQCGHATLGAFRMASKYCKSAIRIWEISGQAKIAVKIEESQMKTLESQAQNFGLVTYTVEDAGRTQIAAGSNTVLAIGPAPASILDTFTKHLKLL